MKDLIQTIFGHIMLIAIIVFVISMNVWLISMLFATNFSFGEVLGCLVVLFIDWLIGICFKATP